MEKKGPWQFAFIAFVASAGCVTQGKFDAQVAENARLHKSYEDESQRSRDCDTRVADLGARLAESEQARAAARGEAERQGELVGRLSKTKEQLEAEKAALERKSAEYQSLSASLADEIKAGRVQISELRGKMTVRLAERVLFPSGSATVNRDGKRTLEKIAAAFHDLKGRIVRVEGHTDDVPIHTAQFPSNWELSAARAIAVVRILQAQGVDPNALGAAGYAEFQPVATNDTPEGRALNRRIEITLATPPPPIADGK